MFKILNYVEFAIQIAVMSYFLIANIWLFVGSALKVIRSQSAFTVKVSLQKFKWFMLLMIDYITL